MLDGLDEASRRSADPADPADFVIWQVARTGRRGRPRIEINTAFLEQALTFRGPEALSRALNGPSSRTIRRRGQDAGLLERGVPVFTYARDSEGNTIRTHRSATARVSNISDDQLDTLIAQILNNFPHFGRRMLAGTLSSYGHNVPRARIVASYIRVHGITNVFGDRRITRRIYKVAGPNALWHHDGQHGEDLYDIYFGYHT